MSDIIVIRRFYTKKWNDKYESTAEMPIIDLCPKCFKEYEYPLYEEEELLPPTIYCCVCGTEGVNKYV